MNPGTVIKSFTSRKGNSVEFRYPSNDEFLATWGFACDIVAEDTFVAINQAPTEAEERKWFQEMLDGVKKGESVRLSVYVNGVFAGNGRVDRGKYRHAHVGSMGLSLAPAYRDEGIGTELMASLIEDAKKIGLRLLTLSCFENNPRALHVYEKLGFQRVGVTPRAIAWKGGYVGEIHLYLPL